METVVGVGGNDETKFEDRTIAETCSELSSTKRIADPVVYKLVRVEGDGRLVPATDDEVMEVEDLLEDDKTEMHFVADTVQSVGCTSNDGFSSRDTQLKVSEGVLQTENAEVYVEKSGAEPGTGTDLMKLDVQSEEIVPSFTPTVNDCHINQSMSVGECSNTPGRSAECGLSTAVGCTSSKPDFSKLEGEICLENLSVKELHETFKATFGRETSVKDKQWLKRRIAMALANSCDVTTSATFIIKDNKVVKKVTEERCKDVECTLAKGPVVGAKNEDSRASSIGHINETGNPQDVSDKRLENYSVEDDYNSEKPHVEQKAAKRVRKPTRRYIEELSEVESREYSGRLFTSVKNSGHGRLSPRSCVRHFQNVRSDGKPVVTRQDSLGGSGVQIPYVSRVRRGRPRENFMALMKLQPSGVGMTAKLVKKALGACGPQAGNERGKTLFTARLAPRRVQLPVIASPKRDMQYSERKTIELEKDPELEHMESSRDNLDDDVVTVPTAKGGIRRKHHRPWTLSEVVKLVEGVARYGAGRWSEIKRLAFASYSYRTSVDLKDKWRNLLRASLAQLPAEKGMQNSRKHASMPIPASILTRVRELAELQTQVPPNFSSSKFTECSDRDVHEASSGYL